MILHSDRGSQFTSDAFRKALVQYGAVQSMSGTGPAANGVDLVTAANELGHTNATTTATIYAHQIATSKAKAADIRSAAFSHRKKEHQGNETDSWFQLSVLHM
ncbi:putative transposase [Oscillibacter valericigenes Sjm18-20]|nr:putative transposase [Oscillibacter valericigenes Sjm18-20]